MMTLYTDKVTYTGMAENAANALPPGQGRHPKLTVIGAGIGDPELITVKAIKALYKANVVLYDALVNEDLLHYAPPEAVRLYAGKRRDKKAYSQEEINRLIVDLALTHGHVVRLKGGDPFVFGRGLEELQYAQEQGLEVAYVAGVSSAIAAAGAGGIAVTTRGASRSFWVLTATTHTGELNPEIIQAAQSEATVVILMGLTKLEAITQVFVDAGKANLPAALIQNATLPHQLEVLGTAGDIAFKAREVDPDGPAVVVFGSVVAHKIDLKATIGISSQWHG